MTLNGWRVPPIKRSRDLDELRYHMNVSRWTPVHPAQVERTGLKDWNRSSAHRRNHELSDVRKRSPSQARPALVLHSTIFKWARATAYVDVNSAAS